MIILQRLQQFFRYATLKLKFLADQHPLLVETKKEESQCYLELYKANGYTSGFSMFIFVHINAFLQYPCRAAYL
jgi:hypothetical protein